MLQKQTNSPGPLPFLTLLLLTFALTFLYEVGGADIGLPGDIDLFRVGDKALLCESDWKWKNTWKF